MHDIILGSGLARAYMEEIMEELLGPIGITGVEEGAGVPDISMWDPEVPKGSLDIEGKYLLLVSSHTW